MDILLILLPLSLVLAALFVWLFVRAARSGQFEDLDDAPLRMLHDD
jgi:cbb3-type cytochrome oxidase maturation protein